MAIFILEIGLLGIAGFFSYSLGVTKLARQETTAANLASGILDEELAKSYDQLANVNKTNYSPDLSSPFYQYQKQVDITCLNVNLEEPSCDSNMHMKKILVTIYWQYNGAEKNYKIATIKTEH